MISKKMVMLALMIVFVFVAYTTLFTLSKRLKMLGTSRTESEKGDEKQKWSSLRSKERLYESVKFKPPQRSKIFTVDEPDFCHRNHDLNIITYVHSAINETAKRKVTRETWAKAGEFDSTVKTALVFMVGLAKTKEEKKILLEESQLYHDIVQGNYIDTYHMLSYKALASLEWVASHCSHVPWTLHTDDDVLIDFFLLTRLLKKFADKKSFLCYTWDNSNVRRKGRWHVGPEEYPETKYPPYCAGAVWVVATPLIHQLLHAIDNAPFLWVDDVYITGILAKAAGIGHSQLLKKYIVQNYINQDGIKDAHLGEKIAWIHILDRTFWWQKILTHYRYVS